VLQSLDISLSSVNSEKLECNPHYFAAVESSRTGVNRRQYSTWVPCQDPHVRPTSILYGVDWWPPDQILASDKESQQNMEEDFDVLSAAKSTDIAKSHLEVNIPYNPYTVKEHDMKEQFCLEVVCLVVNAIIIDS